MAQDVSLNKLYTTGQGAGAGTYVTYAADIDSDHTAIETTINQINQEIAAFGGANAALITDLLTSTTPAVTAGRIDSSVNSFNATFQTADTEILIGLGVALTTAQRIQTGSSFTLVGTGASGTRWVALNADATVTLETAATQGVLDLYSVTWTGSVFTTATLAQLDATIPGGDDFQNALIVAGDGEGSDQAGLPGKTYTRIANVLKDINLILQGDTGGTEGDTLGRMAISGSAATPGILLTDGSTVVDETSGLFRAALGVLGISDTTDTVATFEKQGIDFALQPRVGGRRTAAQTITTATNTLISFTAADDYDVGNGTTDVWHNHSGGSPGDQEFTVPTGGDGVYHVSANIEWDAVDLVDNYYATRITLNAAAVATSSASESEASFTNGNSVSLDLDLVATDVLRVEVAHERGANWDVVDARFTAHKLS